MSRAGQLHHAGPPQDGLLPLPGRRAPVQARDKGVIEILILAPQDTHFLQSSKLL